MVYPVRDIIIIAQPRVPRNTPVMQLQGKSRSTNKLEISNLSIFNYRSTGLSEGSRNSITLNNGTACRGCSPIHTRSTPIPKKGRTKKAGQEDNSRGEYSNLLVLLNIVRGKTDLLCCSLETHHCYLCWKEMHEFSFFSNVL